MKSRMLATCGLTLLVSVPHGAHADPQPVASANTLPPDASDAAPTTVPPASRSAEPIVDPEPDPSLLAKAPPADQASGIAVARPRPSHRIANTLLALPRGVALLLLTGPRYGAAELDAYLESRSPNAFGRDVHQSWRFGATVDWETDLGPSLGLRVGRKLGASTAVDAYGGFFGSRGQSGGVRASLGRYTVAKLEPTLSFDAGREMARVFHGIGDDAGPHAGFDEKGYAATAGIAAHLGLVQIQATGTADHVREGDHGERPISEVYDPALLTGFDEQQRAGTVELSVTFDQRHRTHPWVNEDAPSAGTYVRAAGAFTRGDAAKTGDFSTWRGTVEARQLFDLFHGDRVLSVGIRGEAISAGRDELPFNRLPALGGRDRLRAFARDELRDRATTFAEIEYEWTLGGDSRAYLFVETGGVNPSIDELATSRLHAGYGGGIRFLGGGGTAARFQVAGSDTGDVGFFLQMGAL